MNESLSTSAWPTLWRVEREGAGVAIAARAVARGLALALALVAIAGPAPARAQVESEAEDGGEYEPDQRGEHGEEQAEGGGEYEPDQRGEHEDPARVDFQSMEVAATAESERSAPRDRLGIDASLWLGAGVLGIDAAGGENLVRSTQRSSIAAAFGAAAGVRVGPLIVGPRVGFSLDPSMLLVSTAVGADVLLLEGSIVPYVRGSIGLSLAVPLGDLLPAQGDASILGVGAELAVGVRWYLGDGWFAGAELSGAWHHLWREALPGCTAGCTDGELDLTRPGESDALQLRLGLTLGWSF